MVEVRLRSAGVVPVRRENGAWRVLMLRAYRNWDFPKGLCEPGESPLETAKREASEEADLDDLEFHWGTEGIETEPYARGKVATYYVAETQKTEVVLPISPVLGRPEHHEGRWMSFADAEQHLVPRLQRVLHWARARIGEP